MQTKWLSNFVAASLYHCKRVQRRRRIPTGESIMNASTGNYIINIVQACIGNSTVGSLNFGSVIFAKLATDTGINHFKCVYGFTPRKKVKDDAHEFTQQLGTDLRLYNEEKDRSTLWQPRSFNPTTVFPIVKHDAQIWVQI